MNLRKGLKPQKGNDSITFCVGRFYNYAQIEIFWRPIFELQLKCKILDIPTNTLFLEEDKKIPA